MPPIHPSALLARSPQFNLNTAGVAGFFGGEEAISAMDTVHLKLHHRKTFRENGQLAFWDGLFPGPNDPPAVSFDLDGKKGPRYIAALSGTTMNTGHLAYLTMEQSKDLEEVTVIKGRVTTPCDIAYLAMNHVDYDTPVDRLPLGKALPLGIITILVSVVTCVMCALVFDWYSFSMILFGMVSSGWASFVIGKGRLNIRFVDPAKGAPPGHGMLMGEDGVVVIKGEERDVNAITKGRFILETDAELDKQRNAGNSQVDKGGKHGNDGSKHGDERNTQGDEGSKKDVERTTQGGEGSKQGSEGDTQGGEGSKPGYERNNQGGEGGKQDKGNKRDDDGKGQLAKRKKQADEHSYHAIGFCSLVLLVQFLAQLLLVPQGTLFGQIMFLISLAASWGYNSYLSSLEKEKVQTKILFQKLGKPELRGFRAGTRTTMAVFTCLLLFHRVDRKSEKEDFACRSRILHECIPNDTPVWDLWREKVVKQLLNTDDTSLSSLAHDEDQELSGQSNVLLEKLLEDARAAFRGYFEVRGNLPAHSAPQGAVVQGTAGPLGRTR